MRILKFFLAPLLIVQMLTAPGGQTEMIPAAVNILILFRMSGITPGKLLLLSLPLAGLILMFSAAYVIIPADGSGGNPAASLFTQTARTFLVFISMILFSGYAGIDLLLYAVSIIPSAGFRFFILSLYARLSSLMRTSGSIADQLRARIDLNLYGRAAAARYWVYNIISKEIRSIEWTGISLMMRGDCDYRPVIVDYKPFRYEYLLMTCMFLDASAGIAVSMNLI